MGISIWQILIIVAVVLLLFGGKRLRSLGGDLGSAIKDFKHAMKRSEKSAADGDADDNAKSRQDSPDR